MNLIGNNNQVFVDHQPGNGTRYVVVATRLDDSIPDYGGQWLIALPEIGSTYVFQPAGPLHQGYVAEKLGRTRYGTTLSDVDTAELTKVIGRVTGRTAWLYE
jgi:hypothetical protein